MASEDCDGTQGPESIGRISERPASRSDGATTANGGTRPAVPPAKGNWLDGNVAEYSRGRGPNLLERWTGLRDWFDARLEHGVDPFSKVFRGDSRTRGTALDRAGRVATGINLASQDYLSLSCHPAIKEAACHAASRGGVHSAGSPALMGLSDEVLLLERELAQWLGYREAVVFATGWAAGYGVVRTLVRPDDHIVIDALAHACLQEGARAATDNVHTFRHASARSLERFVCQVRNEHPEAGVLVVTESVFSMDADMPDLADAARVCEDHGATLLVDCAHDLGAMGPDGRGGLAAHGVLGRAGVVMGSFSKTFASNGGFVAFNESELRPALRYACGPQTFSNALSPLQAAVVLASLDIVRSPEGSERRARLAENVSILRAALGRAGFELLGEPSPIVPVIVGETALARLTYRETSSRGALVNLVEYPAVSRKTTRYRLQVMSDHDPSELRGFAEILTRARDAARSKLRLLALPTSSPALPGSRDSSSAEDE